MQDNEDISEVNAPEAANIGENSSQGVLGAWHEQLWDWGQGNEGRGAPNTGAHISAFRPPPFASLLP